MGSSSANEMFAWNEIKVVIASYDKNHFEMFFETADENKSHGVIEKSDMWEEPHFRLGNLSSALSDAELKSNCEELNKS